MYPNTISNKVWFSFPYSIVMPISLTRSPLTKILNIVCQDFCTEHPSPCSPWDNIFCKLCSFTRTIYAQISLLRNLFNFSSATLQSTDYFHYFHRWGNHLNFAQGPPPPFARNTYSCSDISDILLILRHPPNIHPPLAHANYSGSDNTDISSCSGIHPKIIVSYNLGIIAQTSPPPYSCLDIPLHPHNYSQNLVLLRNRRHPPLTQTSTQNSFPPPLLTLTILAQTSQTSPFAQTSTQKSSLYMTINYQHSSRYLFTCRSLQTYAVKIG